MNVASTAAFQPGPRMAVYYASKAFVLSFSEAINYELRKTKVTVTALCPGPTDSGFFEGADMLNTNMATNGTATSRAVAEFGYTAMMKGKDVAIHGLKNRLLAIGSQLSPRQVVLPIANAFQNKKS